MLKRGAATGITVNDLRAMFESAIANMSVEDLRSCYQGEVADEDTGEVHGKFLLTYATIGSMYYYTFIVERAKISDSSICYSVVNVESGLEVLSVTFTGVSWICNNGAISASRTIDVFSKIYSIL